MNKLDNYSNPYDGMTTEQFLQTVKRNGEIANSENRFTYNPVLGLEEKEFSLTEMISNLFHLNDAKKANENRNILQATNDLNTKAFEIINSDEVYHLKAYEIENLENNLKSINARIGKIKSDVALFNAVPLIDQSIKTRLAVEGLTTYLKAQSNEEDKHVSDLLRLFKVSGRGDFYLEPTTSEAEKAIEKQLKQENQLFLENENIQKSDPALYTEISRKQMKRVRALMLFYTLGNEKDSAAKGTEQQLIRLVQQVDEKTIKLEQLKQNSPLLKAYAGTFFDRENLKQEQVVTKHRSSQDTDLDPYSSLMMDCRKLLVSHSSSTIYPADLTLFETAFNSFSVIIQSIKNKLADEKERLEKNRLTAYSDREDQQVSHLLHQFKVSNAANGELYLEPATNQVYADIEKQLAQENQLFLENEKIQKLDPIFHSDIRQKQMTRVRMLLLFYVLSPQKGQVAKGRGADVDQLMQFTRQVDAQISKLDHLKQNNPLLQAYAGAFFDRESQEQEIYDVTEKLVNRPDQDVSQDLYTSFMKGSQQLLIPPMDTQGFRSFKATVDKFFTP